MPGQRGDVAGLHGHAGRQLILDSEIGTHRVRRLVVELNSAQLQTAGVDQERSKRIAREASFKGRGSAWARRRTPGKRSARADGRNVVGRRVGEIELEGIILANVRRKPAVFKAVVKDPEP